jgi:hypothetical protein
MIDVYRSGPQPPRKSLVERCTGCMKNRGGPNVRSAPCVGCVNHSTYVVPVTETK